MKKIMLMCVMLGSMMFSGLAFAGGAVNVNVATSVQLQEIKGIGPKTAEAIIAYRDEHGAFSSVAGLTAVKGIGDKKLLKIQDGLTVEKE